MVIGVMYLSKRINMTRVLCFVYIIDKKGNPLGCMRVLMDVQSNGLIHSRPVSITRQLYVCHSSTFSLHQLSLWTKRNSNE